MKITHEVQISSEKDAFTNSREALATLLKQNQHFIWDLKKDLELINYQNLKHFPEYVISLSHTSGAGAAVLAKKADILSVGIDIEWSDRPIKEEASRFYRHPEDSPHENGLELWTMKEAAFKALSPLYNDKKISGVLVLSKIIIQNGKFWSNMEPAICGKVKMHSIGHPKKLFVALALINGST